MIPFFISVPSSATVDAVEHKNVYVVDEWLYEITAVPKNEKGTIEIDKWILNDSNIKNDLVDDLLSKGEDYTIGDAVPYIIKADVLASMEFLKTYTIGDQLSAGLTFDKVGNVYGTKVCRTDVRLQVDTHYTVSEDLDDQVDVKNYAGIEFELQDATGTKIQVKEDGTGNYRYIVADMTTMTPPPADDSLLVNPSNGEVGIVGLGAGQYQLVELTTAAKHTLLKEPIIFSIQATFTGENFVADDNGDFFEIEVGREYFANGELVVLDGFSVGDYIEVKKRRINHSN